MAIVDQKSNQISLEQQAHHIMQENNFIVDKEIYRGFYYDSRVRDIIYTGSYEEKSAVFKIYDDPRILYEPKQLADFHAQNTSSLLTAPKLYASQIISPHKGWLITEELPTGSFFQSPLSRSTQHREEFLQIFTEYRTHFPTQPTRQLSLSESLPSDEFHFYRIHKWMTLAEQEDEDRLLKGADPILDPASIMPRYLQAIQIIKTEFQKRPMQWSHGHFYPSEVYKADSGKYYVLDFSHTKMYPQGYEYALMIWADALMKIHPTTTYTDLIAQVQEWIAALTPIAKHFGITHFDTLIRASMLERILGTLFADITANTTVAYEDKLHRRDLLIPLLDSFLTPNHT